MPRKALQDFSLGRYHIRKGDRLQLSLMQLLENDSRWAHLPAGSPLALGSFAPERWLEWGGDEGKGGGWLPFGAGARMCLGYPLALAEIKVGGLGVGGWGGVCMKWSARLGLLPCQLALSWPDSNLSD